MLEVIEYGKGEYEFPALVVLGCFDAIHAGHRELLKKAKLQAKINGLDLGVMMFRGGKGGKLVYSFEERCAILESYNVKFVVAVDFTDEFKAVAPLDFLREVEEKINVKAYMSGKDFRFGAGAKGKSSTLKNYAEDEENGVWYMPVKDVDLKGEKISTTLIKSCLDEGNVAKANELLGAEFSVSGEVVKGEGRGTSVVGFPTVNIVYPEWKHPLKHGVYSVKCMVGETDYQGIANFGNCPTFADERVALEVYLEGFSGDLYGQILTIRFIDYIRDIEAFGSAEELSGQLHSDLLTVTDELAVTEAVEVEENVAEVVAEPEPVAEEVAVAEEPVAEEVYDDLSDDGLEEAIDAAEEEIVAEEQEVETEEPVQSVEEVVEVPAEEPVEEPTEELVEEPVEEIIEESPEEPVEEAVAEEVADEPEVEQTEEIEQPVEDVIEDEVVEEQPVEDVIEDEVVEEQPIEEVIEDEVVEEQPIEEVVEDEVSEEAVAEEEQKDEPSEEIIEETVVEEEVPEEQPVDDVIEEAVYTDGEETGDGEEN